jgi:hypothetical protein
MEGDAIGSVEAGGGEQEDQNREGSPHSGYGCGARCRALLGRTAEGGCPHMSWSVDRTLPRHTRILGKQSDAVSDVVGKICGSVPE